MNTIRATWRNGQIIPEVPANWPERVKLLVSQIEDVDLKVTYRQLKEVLEKRGWTAEPIETDNFGRKRKSTVFQNPKSDLYIILPRMRANKVVEPIHLLHVRNVLENSGFWESLAKQTNTENHEQANNVLRTLAGIKVSNQASP